MPFIDTEITYGGKKPTDSADGDALLASLIFEPVLTNPALTSLGYDIREDIQSSETMYSLVKGDKITKKKVGCGFNPSGKLADLIDKEISVVKLAAELEQCAEDFDGTILALMKKKGYNRTDLTGTQLETLLSQIAIEIISQDIQRIASLGDTASANADYNQLDGKWKKIFAGVADGGRIKKTAELPDNGALADNAAIGYLKSVFFNAPLELQSLPENQKVIHVTRSVYNNYLLSFTSNTALESSYVNLQNGIRTLSYMGVPLVVEDIVDRYVAADAAVIPNPNPHRILYMAENNITLATDLASDFTYVDFWYEKKPQMNYMRSEFKLGIALGFDKYFSVAY